MSRKQHEVLIVDNFRFHKENKYTDKTYSKCVQYKSSCKACIQTMSGEQCFIVVIVSFENDKCTNSGIRSYLVLLIIHKL